MSSAPAHETTNGKASPVDFLLSIFRPGEYMLYRPTETWTEGGRRQSRIDYESTDHLLLGMLNHNTGEWQHFPSKLETFFTRINGRSAHQRTNSFFGVCPRVGGQGLYDQAWQIRTVPTLWVDVDDAKPIEAAERCKAAGLPEPSAIVSSGRGAHLYWFFGEPFLIDDAGKPPPVDQEFAELPDGKKRRRLFYLDANQKRVYLDARQNVPALSAKAQLIQDTLKGIAAKIGGDHTTDLSRLLRLPGTLNRKNERNGQEPVPCELAEFHPERRYAIDAFRHLAAEGGKEREQIRQVPLPGKKRKSAKRDDSLRSLLAQCAAAEVGHRSEADFAYCCAAIEAGLSEADTWSMASGVGKFAEAGATYFTRTWQAAVEHVQTTIFHKARKAHETRAAAVAAKADEQQQTGQEPDRPQILVGVDESRVIDQAVAALADSPIFQRGGGLVHVTRDTAPPRGIARPKDAPRIGFVRQARIRELLAAAADWLMPAGESEPNPTHPPDWAVQGLAARPHWPGIRPLEGIVEFPAIRSNGTVLQHPGYDALSGLIYEPQIIFPPVPDTPTSSDVKAALALLQDPFADFCLNQPTHQAAALAGLLTPLARYAYHGPSPLFLIDANARGVGKGLLIDVLATVLFGREMARTTAPVDDAEFRKLVTSLAIAGEPAILLDNLPPILGNPTLDAALTAVSWTDRILGRSEMACQVPLRAVWYATGNNVILGADTARRTCHIRLETDDENPEERTGFRHPQLLVWVRDNRPQLVAAAVTLLRAYFAAGRPDMHLRPWGSFEAWSDVIRNCLVWLGLPDPGDTRQELATTADSEPIALRKLIDGWSIVDPDGDGMLISDVLNAIEELNQKRLPLPDGLKLISEAITDLCPGRGGKPATARGVAMKIHHLKRRVIAGRCLDTKESKMGHLWFVRGIDTPRQQQNSGGTGGTGGTVSNSDRQRNYLEIQGFSDGRATTTSSTSSTSAQDANGMLPQSRLSPAEEEGLNEFLRS